MRKGLFGAVCVAAVVVLVETGRAQSLADVARAEATRRKAQGKTTAKTYTNEDLKSGKRTPEPAPDGSTGKPAASAPAGSTAPAGSAASAATASTPAQPSQTVADPPKDEKYWRNRMTAARTALQRSESFIEALQSHINGLYAEFVAMGDPFQRAGIEKKRNEAIAEQDRVKADVALQKKAIAAIEEEARRASVPSGWLR